MKKTKNEAPLVLTSTEPINDGGRKYNFIYLVCALILGIAFISGGFLGVGFGIVLGLCLGWLVKNRLMDMISTSLRYKEFQIKNKVPYSELIAKLIPVLLPLGMMIEKSSDKDGRPVISYQGVIYDVTYDETKDVFTIWWRVNVARAFLKVDCIGRYRKIVAAMGIIGYHVQQICNRPAPAFTQNATDGNVENAEVEDKKFCTRCGAALAKGAKFCPGCGSAVNN